MIVERIKLKNFRSYDYVDISLKKGLNVFVGPNGSGKTNLAEAIHYLSLARSFRTSDDKELIKNGCDAATISAQTAIGEFKNDIKINLSKESKTVLINAKKIKKISTLSNIVNVIIFKPSDTNIFKASPSVRRKFLDIAISKQNDVYLENLTNYTKLLKERNEILKAENIDLLHLSVIDEQLSFLALSISRERKRYIDSLNKILIKVISSLDDNSKELRLVYKPFIDLKDTNREMAQNLYNASMNIDVKNKTTSVGPHREDFDTIYNGGDISKYGSQGENRIAAIALILTPYFLISDEDKKPIVILDDVLSELDKNHQERLVTLLSKLEQSVITATSYSRSCACTYVFKESKITRREP